MIISQYIGKGNREQAGLAAGQLLTASILLSILSMFLILVFDTQSLGLLCGRVEPSVMEACVTYLRISAYSYPALAIYNAGSALYHSLGDT